MREGRAKRAGEARAPLLFAFTLNVQAAAGGAALIGGAKIAAVPIRRSPRGKARKIARSEPILR